jgi:hypothetical protein
MSETAQAVQAREAAAAAHRAESHPATVREYIESLLVTVILALFRHDVCRAGVQDSLAIHGANASGRRSSPREQIYFRRARALVRPCASLPRNPPRRHHRFQISVSGSPALRQTRDWNSRRPRQDRGPAGVRQRQADHRAVHRARSRRSLRSLRRQLSAAQPGHTCRPTCSRNGPTKFFNTFTTAKSSSLPENTSPWAITATIAGTAGSGDSWTATLIMGRPVVIYWSVIGDEGRGPQREFLVLESPRYRSASALADALVAHAA